MCSHSHNYCCNGLKMGDVLHHLVEVGRKDTMVVLLLIVITDPPATKKKKIVELVYETNMSRAITS